MARTMKPEAALAACYPDVAATWHPERNGTRTPADTSSKNSFRAWWRCPAGHEWEEIVATRTGLPGWKGGERAACRVCVGYHVIAPFDCGHTAEVPAAFAEPQRGCPSCRKRRWQEAQAEYQARRVANSATAKRAYADSGERAAALLDDCRPPDDTPAPLVAEWRRVALHAVRVAIVSEEQFGKTGAVGTALAAQRRLAANLVPSVEDLRTAVARREPTPVLGRAHWPIGWLHHLGALEHDTTPAPDVLNDLDSHLRQEVAALEALFGKRQLQMGDVTGLLTELIAGWAYDQEGKWRDRRWNVFRELSLPITPGKSSRFGRLDLTIMRPQEPDMVVEIDSTHKEESLEKLVFARDAGALAVWVRWHGGRFDVPPGIHGVDLIAATRPLTS
ncbi:zinc-ribbon domain-containing protein [Longivirga aurantiaca]|uniref:Zinc-ribbon domain-containing protein n=1 Tax=Longivirga aurantiaca TaxID=1837743 RepID=A0ABW1SZZ2_9ACTN